jgi:hypothetical protein
MAQYLQRYYELHAVVRADIVAEARQFSMDAVAELAEWCGAQLELRDDGRHVLVVPPGPIGPGGVAELGDYVMRYGIEQWVEPAGGFRQRWHSAGDEVPDEQPTRVYPPFHIDHGPNPWS